MCRPISLFNGRLRELKVFLRLVKMGIHDSTTLLRHDVLRFRVIFESKDFGTSKGAIAYIFNKR